MVFSNIDEHVSSRLLGLYPLEVLREEYGVQGLSARVHEDVFKNTQFRDIREDALRLMGHCRQHVYLFEMTRAAQGYAGPMVAMAAEHHASLALPDGTQVDEYLIPMDYRFLLVKSRTADQKEMRFLWPIRILRKGNILQVRMVIMEQHMRSSDQAVFRGRNLDEQMLINHVLSRFVDVGSVPTALDLNKGIKHLWENDVVDAPRVTHKNSKSLDNSFMDTGFTFKKQYPLKYKEVIRNPLRKTTFLLINRPTFPISFMSDPGAGFVSFARFQSDPKAIDRLIDEVLANN